jgi:hypothetical protein
VSLLTLLTFSLLSPSLRVLSPSSFFSPGAFAARSLPATMGYATPAARGSLNEIYRLHGCHTCGFRPSPLSSRLATLQQFNADHIPPLSLVKWYNNRWYNKLVRRTIAQRFYPQCKGCSSVQGAALARNSMGSILSGSGFQVLAPGKFGKLHVHRLRRWHLTGFAVAAAGAGGEGGSDAWGNRVWGEALLREAEVWAEGRAGELWERARKWGG